MSFETLPKTPRPDMTTNVFGNKLYLAVNTDKTDARIVYTLVCFRMNNSTSYYVEPTREINMFYKPEKAQLFTESVKRAIEIEQKYENVKNIFFGWNQEAIDQFYANTK